MLAEVGNKVVYWIGAGASAGALPVVKEMDDAFSRQADVVAPGRQLANINPRLKDRQLRVKYARYLDKMARWSKEYGTIDTYARSLFLLQKEIELAELKFHLTMFFLLEDAIAQKWGSATERRKSVYKKQERVDTRYLGWLALLMSKETGISKRVNVISWNYDLQFEQALALFRGHSTLGQIHDDDQIHIFPNLGGVDDIGSSVPSLIRLNGVIGHIQSKGSTDILYQDVNVPKGDVENIVGALFAKYQNYMADLQLLRSSVGSLTFSWEQTAVAQKAIQLAKGVMEQADVLVVIGYSFPSFNRIVDKELFHAFSDPDKKAPRVILQSGSITPETFKEMMGIADESVAVVQEKSIAQFYVPKELF